MRIEAQNEDATQPNFIANKYSEAGHLFDEK